MHIAASLSRALINNAVPRGPRLRFVCVYVGGIRSVMTDALSLLPQRAQEGNRRAREARGERKMKVQSGVGIGVTLRHDYIAF